MSSHASELALKSQFIRAGAGAGKTRRLIHSFIDFVLAFKAQHDRWPRVVITTFTRKATQEVKERLLVEALNRGQQELFEYINQKSFVHISTIHGVLSLLLGQHADQLRFPQEIKVLDSTPAERILKKQINEIFKKTPEFIELLETYSFKELIQISHLALQAKAQCAELTYLTAKELQLFAAQERQKLAERIDEVFKAAASQEPAWSAYFDYLKALQRALVDSDDVVYAQLVENKPSKPRWSEAKPSLDPVAHEIVKELQGLVDKTQFDSSEYILQHEKLNALFLKFIEILADKQFQFKQQSGQMEIADLENLTLKLIQDHPNAVQEFSDSWDYFMVDEYQDTSPVQVQILNQIIGQKPCFIVGDPQQSIYLFRGARSEVFDIKQKEMEAANARVDFLKINYRSEPTLMNHINELVTKMSPQFKAMDVKSETSPQKSLPVDTYFINSKHAVTATIEHIIYLKQYGIALEDISVLARQNKILEEVAYQAGQIGLPMQLQAAVGFESKREILDLMSFNRFLVNPHDDENLITLLRSPWLALTDAEILQLANIRDQIKSSYWKALLQSQFAVQHQLKDYLLQYEQAGVLSVNQSFVDKTYFLNFSKYYDSTGKREANIFKFLNTLADAEKRPQFSLGLFLEEQFQALQSDLGSGQGEAQPVEQPHCVSLMTVHAAKGLQFKHVIVLGLADKINTTNSLDFAFSPELKKFSLAAFDTVEQNKKPSSWSVQLRKSLNNREILESERVLYVALTRAIESLSLVNDSSKKPDKNSWIAKLAWPPSDAEYKGVDYSYQALEYDALTNLKTLVEQKNSTARAPYASARVEATTHLSVTDILGDHLDDQAAGGAKVIEAIEPEVQIINLKKAQFGTDLHRLFESMKYQDLAKLKKQLNSKDLAAVDYLLGLAEINILQLLAEGHNEWGFGLKTTKRYIQGQIDLWAELSDEIHVLDYKTGSSAYSAKAFEQLCLYTKALLQMQQISKQKKIIHSVVYPIEKTIKQKTYLNADTFELALSEKIKDSFS